jgi:hypothetical protein
MQGSKSAMASRRKGSERAGNLHDGPRLGPGDGSSESEDLSGEHPPDETDGVLGLVVGGDSDVNELEGSVGVAEGDDGDVDEGRLPDGLVVDSGVSDDDDPGLLERSGNVVGAEKGNKGPSSALASKEWERKRQGRAYKLPGVNRPAMAWAPVAEANLRTAR